MQVHQRKLLRDVVEICILMQSLRILRVERLGHVQAVKPHLIGIDLLVPEPAVGSTWLGLQLSAQKRGRLEVLFFFRDLIEQQQNSAVEYVVEVVVVKPVRLNRAIIAYKLIDAALDVLEVIPVTRVTPNALHAFQHDGLFVTPSRGSAGFRSGIVLPKRHYGRGHPLRERSRLSSCRNQERSQKD